MKNNDIAKPEDKRLAELAEYEILQEMEKTDYDCLTSMAAKICKTDISLISIITKDKQQIISGEGIKIREIPRELSLCSHAITTPQNPLIIENVAKDERFAGNPIVRRAPEGAFYAGIPLVNEDGFALGTLCVIDRKPRILQEEEIATLKILARQAMNLLELRKKTRLLQSQNVRFEETLELFNEAQKMSKIGSWELNTETGDTYWTDEVYEIHEVELNFEHNKDNGIRFYHPADQKKLEEALIKCKENAEPFTLTCRFITAKGNNKWVRVTGRAKETTGTVKYIRGTFQDVSLEKEKAEQLKIERMRALSVIDGTMAGTWEWNIQTGETIYNERWAEIIGYTLSELEPIGSDTWKKFVHPDDLISSNKSLEEYFAGKRDFYEHEIRMKRKDGTWAWVLDRGKVFSNCDNGKPLMMYGTHQDISERKEAEELLRISEQTFRGSFEHAAIGIALMGKNGEWLKVNSKVCEIVGYSEEELRQLTFQDITHPDDLHADLDLMQELIRGGRDTYTMEKRYFHKNGHLVYIILAVSMVKDHEGGIKHFVSQIVDVTDLKMVQFQLSESIANYRAILNATTQSAIITTDLNFTITSFNSGAEQMLGYSADEIIGSTSPDIFLVGEEISRMEKEIQSTQGKQIRGLDVFIIRAKEKGAETIEVTFVHKNGGQIPVLLSVTSILNDNNIIGYLGVATDITTIKKTETELRALLDITQNQNERLKNFAHIVAHNLRSHSGSISSLIEILGEDAPGITAMSFYKHLQNASVSLMETIEHLTEVVKINLTAEEKSASIKLHQVAERAVSAVSVLAAKSNVAIYNQVPESAVIKAIPAYMDSIIMNFITNAIKYSDPAKESYIKIRSESDDGVTIITFEDNGLGIDLRKYGHYLFGMYKTFHSHKDSRGVGLFITKNQIEAMNGKVEVESSVGVGTTFKVYLPE